MKTKTWLVLGALLALAACATEEARKPPAPPAPAPAPAASASPAPAPKPAQVRLAPANPVAEKARIAAELLFDFDRATIRPDGRSVLDGLAAKARAISIESLIVTGYADRIGSAAHNLDLSRRRADAVKAYLASKGFAASRIYPEGKGKAQPVTGDKCRNMGPENRRNRKLIACLQPDRRVEIELIGTRGAGAR